MALCKAVCRAGVKQNMRQTTPFFVIRGYPFIHGTPLVPIIVSAPTICSADNFNFDWFLQSRAPSKLLLAFDGVKLRTPRWRRRHRWSPALSPSRPPSSVVHHPLDFMCFLSKSFLSQNPRLSISSVGVRQGGARRRSVPQQQLDAVNPMIGAQ